MSPSSTVGDTSSTAGIVDEMSPPSTVGIVGDQSSTGHGEGHQRDGLVADTSYIYMCVYMYSRYEPIIDSR